MDLKREGRGLQDNQVGGIGVWRRLGCHHVELVSIRDYCSSVACRKGGQLQLRCRVL